MVLLYRKSLLSLKTNEKGFTLVELMIALLVSGLVMTGVVSVYVVQSRSYSVHGDIANIQQDLRGVLAIMPMEIRLAGCDPTESGLPGIVTATNTLFRFTMDTRTGTTSNVPDGVIGTQENIAYGLAAGVDTNGDGIVDNGGGAWSGVASLGRHLGTGALILQPLADNIQALEFNYILEGGMATNGTGIATATQANNPIANVNAIRAVQVSILARTANQSQGFFDTKTYTTASGVVWNPPDDGFRRRLVVTNIQCRNMGI